MIDKKILFVDDEESQRDVMKRVLTKMGYSVTTAASAEEAILILDAESFPLIITDLSMPGMDGTMLCGHIRQKAPLTVVYALSGYIESYEASNLEKIGFDGYLRKPATSKMLKEAVEGAFEKIARSVASSLPGRHRSAHS